MPSPLLIPLNGEIIMGNNFEEDEGFKAWETAMGMRGYAGSPAQKADLAEQRKKDGVCLDVLTNKKKRNKQ